MVKNILSLLLSLLLILFVVYALIKVFPVKAKEFEKYVGYDLHIDEIIGFGTKVRSKTTNIKLENIGEGIEGSVKTKYVK